MYQLTDSHTHQEIIHQGYTIRFPVLGLLGNQPLILLAMTNSSTQELQDKIAILFPVRREIRQLVHRRILRAEIFESLCYHGLQHLFVHTPVDEALFEAS